MAGPQPCVIQLSEAERQGLEKLVNRRTVEQQKALRGRIVLLAATKQNNPEIAWERNVGIDMARLWRRRWLELQPIPLEDMSIEERLEDLPVWAHLRISPPTRSAKWNNWLARNRRKPGVRSVNERMQRGIVAQISPRHAARLLKKGVSNHT